MLESGETEESVRRFDDTKSKEQHAKETKQNGDDLLNFLCFDDIESWDELSKYSFEEVKLEEENDITLSDKQSQLVTHDQREMEAIDVDSCLCLLPKACEEREHQLQENQLLRIVI